MRFDPVLAALVKESGPAHPDYAAVQFQEEVIALGLEGRVKLRQPRQALIAEVREIIRQEQEERAAGLRAGRDPSAIIAAHLEQARRDRKENPVERVLRELAKAPTRPVRRKVQAPGRTRCNADPNAIIDEVCSEHRISRHDLLGSSRRQDRAMARFDLFHRLRSHTNLSAKAIGQMVGNRHHTTVPHGARQWRRLHPHPAVSNQHRAS